ncbi:MAG: hypothetical protein ABWY06_01595 [Pseudomonas sp.]|uniref:hypothetical protein n=1 Tax=Pseudomonas sp. TaxID=306 RepID=UPI00339206FF
MPSAAELQALQARLERALQGADWASFGAIDAAIREALLQLDGQPSSAALKVARQSLKRVHGEALRGCANESERLRKLLLAHLHYAEGNSAYRQVNDWQESR